MTDEPRTISATRWAIFEVEPPDRGGDDRTHLWLKRTAASSLSDWADRKRARLEEIVAEQSLTLGRFRPDLSSRHGHRVTPESLQALRGKIVTWLTGEGFVVVPDAPNEVYAIELDAMTADGRRRLYVGVTSDLARRLAEHRGDIDDGSPPGKAVKRHGFLRYRGDLVEDFPHVPKAAAEELEAQVSALLRHRGFEVHGDGVGRQPSNTHFVTGISWQELITAYEAANDS